MRNVWLGWSWGEDRAWVLHELRRIARGVGTWIGVGALSLGLLECVLRLADRDPVFIHPLNSFHVGHDVVGWIGAPDFAGRFVRPEFDVWIANGERGFRESGAEVAPASGAARVTFLGDSFTWGWGVGQGEVFTDRLQDRVGPGFAIRNRGVNAWGSVQQALLLEELLVREPTDAVAVMFFRNDFANNLEGKGGRRPYLEVGTAKSVARPRSPCG